MHRITSYNVCYTKLLRPDSFLLSYFRRLIEGKPYLELEVDDHTAEAGMLTRCEAFLDSLGVRREVAA